MAKRVRKTAAKPKAAPKVEGATVGRPSAYKPEYAAQAEKLCLLGAKDDEIADFFGVSTRTIYRWQVEHEEFSQSLKATKEKSDDRVVRSLFHRATGYSHPDVDIRVVDGVVIKTDIIKHYPPDTTAMIFWLKNRKKIEWRDKHELSGDPDAPMVTEVVIRGVKPKPSQS